MTKVTTQAALKHFDSLIEKASADKDRIDVDEAREVLAKVKRGEESTTPWAKIKKDLGL